MMKSLEQINRDAAYEAAWQERARKLEAAGPMFAALKADILADARRRGVMHLVRWVDLGLASGLFPVPPPDFCRSGSDTMPAIGLNGDRARR